MPSRPWQPFLTLVADAVRARLPGRTHERSEDGITSNADHRREQLANLSTAAYVRLQIAKLRGRFVPEERKREVMDEAIVKTAQDAFEVIGNMKGVMMKLAQFASFQPGVPEGAREQLKALQSAAPSMTYELVAECIERELGSAPDVVFARFDREPLASASIGQVHRARMHDGREVAVKVQYPGADDAIRADIANAGVFIKAVEAIDSGGPDRDAILNEVAARVVEEVDYLQEARNQKWFANRYRGHPFVKIPEVIDELSTPRVLVTEYVEGRRFYDVLDSSADWRDRTGEIIFRFAFTSILLDGVFSGDPHPGNYLFMDDGRVCFLDFGLVKHMDTRERTLLRGPMAAMVDGDVAALRSTLGELGVLKRDATLTDDELWPLFEQILGAVSEDATVKCSMERATTEREERREGRRDLRGQLELTPLVVFFMRYRRGTWAVLAHLGAEGNWHRMLREVLYNDEPSTELGAAWAHAEARARA
jgi:predicted unusual protein kinase regulating ubiquinone biosynthesis (AarF/ABC1/UbiB family)